MNAGARVIWSVCEVSDITPVLDFMLSRENRAEIKGCRGEAVWTERTWQLYFLLFHMLMPPVCQGRGATGSSKLTPVIHNTEHPSSVWTEAAFVTQAKKFLPNESITDRSPTSILTKACCSRTQQIHSFKQDTFIVICHINKICFGKSK